MQPRLPRQQGNVWAHNDNPREQGWLQLGLTGAQSHLFCFCLYISWLCLLWRAPCLCMFMSSSLQCGCCSSSFSSSQFSGNGRQRTAFLHSSNSKASAVSLTDSEWPGFDQLSVFETICLAEGKRKDSVSYGGGEGDVNISERPRDSKGGEMISPKQISEPVTIGGSSCVGKRQIAPLAPWYMKQGSSLTYLLI